jgi:hypothetical protein
MYAVSSKLKKIGITLLATAFVMSHAGTVSAQTRYTDAANKALVWMKTQQQAEGSFAGFGAGSTIDAVLAIIAARQDPSTYVKGGNTPITFLESKAAELSTAPGGAGKLLLMAETLNMDGRSFGGVNLLDVINKSYNAQSGQYGPDMIGHAFNILGLASAGQAVPPEAITFIERSQNGDGGWSFSGEAGPGKADTNTTSVVLQALVAAGTKSEMVMKKAMTYLASQQNEDGGFPFQKGGEFGSDSDVNSTAYVVQAALVFGDTDMAEVGLDFILSMQKPSGAFQWMATEPDDNAGATYQAIPVLFSATLVSPLGAAVYEGSPAVEPGMPRTGWGDASPIAALAALGVLAISVGIVSRRRATAR